MAKIFYNEQPVTEVIYNGNRVNTINYNGNTINLPTQAVVAKWIFSPVAGNKIRIRARWSLVEGHAYDDSILSLYKLVG